MDLLYIELTPEGVSVLNLTLILRDLRVIQSLQDSESKSNMTQLDYKRFKIFEDYPMRRSNPDLDGIVYLDKTGKETLAMFNTLTPKSIDEATYPQPGNYGYMSESPIETLAYFIDFDYAGEKFPYNYLVEDTIKYQKEIPLVFYKSTIFYPRRWHGIQDIHMHEKMELPPESVMFQYGYSTNNLESKI